MERIYSKRGKGYQFFLIIALFVSGSIVLVFVSLTFYNLFRIDRLVSLIQDLQNEAVPDLERIEAFQLSLEYLRNYIFIYVGNMGIGIGLLALFIFLQIKYIKIEREPFKLEVSASQRIEQAIRNQSEGKKLENT